MSNENIEIIKKYYPTYGFKKCMELTNLDRSQIRNLTYRLGIKIENIGKYLKENRTRKCSDVCVDSLTTNITPESSYMLGFLWADGHVSKSVCRISLSIQKEDMDILKETFDNVIDWNYYKVKEKNGWKPVIMAYTGHKILHKFLVDNDYSEKSTKSACNILKHIPEKLHHYFFRGVVDGDGSFYINEKQYLYQFALSSSYDQDWTYFINLLKQLGIKFKIQKTSRINNKDILNRSSQIRITNKKEISKLFDYIYQDFEFDKMGLLRKYEKAKFIHDRSKMSKKDMVSKNLKPVSINGVIFNNIDHACDHLLMDRKTLAYRVYCNREIWKDWYIIQA